MKNYSQSRQSSVLVFVTAGCDGWDKEDGFGQTFESISAWTTSQRNVIRGGAHLLRQQCDIIPMDVDGTLSEKNRSSWSPNCVQLQSLVELKDHGFDLCIWLRFETRVC